MENILEQPTSTPGIEPVVTTLEIKNDRISSALEDDAVLGSSNISASLDFEGHDPQSLLTIMKRRVDLKARVSAG
jgi:hypothetical protein